MTGGNEASFPLDITNGETGTLFAYSFSDFGAVNTVTGSSSL